MSLNISPRNFTYRASNNFRAALGWLEICDHSITRKSNAVSREAETQSHRLPDDIIHERPYILPQIRQAKPEHAGLNEYASTTAFQNSKILKRPDSESVDAQFLHENLRHVLNGKTAKSTRFDGGLQWL